MRSVKIPDKVFFRGRELAHRWRYAGQTVFDYVSCEMLTPSLFLNGEEGFHADKVNERDPELPMEFHGCYGLYFEDVRRLDRAGSFEQIEVNRLFDESYIGLEEYPEIVLLTPLKIYGRDIVFSLKERIRFEKEHGLFEQLEPITGAVPGRELLELEFDLPKAETKETDRSATKKEVHGNAIRYASKRQEVVGAALALLAQYPEMCRDDKQNVRAAKVRKLIEEKALLFWPETGEPPLSSEVIEKLLNSYLKQVR